MSRHPTSTSFLTPVKSDGTVQVASNTEFGRGTFTLTSGTTYYLPIGGQDCPISSLHCHWDAAIILTTLTIEDCNAPGGNASTSEVPSYVSGATGLWIPEGDTTSVVKCVGAGASATSGVVAVTGGAAGGCMFHVADTGARRTRLAIVVGGTGGEMQFWGWGKE